MHPTESTPTSSDSGKARKGWQSVVRQQINDLWSLIAVGMVFVDATDSEIFITRAPAITEAIIHIAEVKPAFRKMLLRTSEGALYVELIGAIAPIIVLICVNHKVLPQMLAIPFGGLPTHNSNNGGSNGNFDASGFSDLFSTVMASGGASDNYRADR